MSAASYPHRLWFDITLGTTADPRAPGGAVTMALCGTWDHEEPCRWPHYSDPVTRGDRHRLIVGFDAPAAEVDEVAGRIRQAVNAGEQQEPSGAHSTWLCHDHARDR